MAKYRGLDQLIRRGVLDTVETVETGMSGLRPEAREYLREEALKRSDMELRQVCAKVAAPLADRLDRAVDTIGCSKREFLERAIIAAIDRVDEISDEEGLPDLIDEMRGAYEASRADA